MENEVWKDIDGYEGLYQVSNLGRVKSLKNKKILKYSKNYKGYCQINLYKNGKRKKYCIHRLVALGYVNNILNKEQVNHIDGNKENNCVYNLEWVTCSENNKHAYKIGLNKSHTERKVNQYDKEGNFIKTWESIRDFLRKNNLSLKSSTISRCCKHKIKSAYGYKWEYFD